MKRKLIISAAVITLASLVGCGQNTTTTNTPTNTNQSQVNTSTNSKPTIAVLLFTRKFQFMVALDDGIRKEASKLGINVTVLDGQGSSQVQMNQIEDALTKKVSAIIIDPNDSVQLLPGIKAANNAHVPVVTVDGVMAKGADVYSGVLFDNVAGGKALAQYIGSQVKKGSVLELSGRPGHEHDQLRHQGFQDGIAGTGLNLITEPTNFDTATAQRITATQVTAHPDIAAIGAETDGLNPGVITALKQLNKFHTVGQPGHITIAGLDGTPDALNDIRQGLIDATVQQDPVKMGELSVDQAFAAIQGKPASSPLIQLPPTLVTKSNVDDPSLWGNQVK